MKIVLLSIKPRFAEEILHGIKHFELRAGSGIEQGSRIIMYASSPKKPSLESLLLGEFLSVIVSISSTSSALSRTQG